MEKRHTGNRKPPVVIFGKLDRYLARKFLGTVVFMIAITAVVAVVFDFSEKVEDIIESQISTREVVFDYYFNMVPNIINQVSPMMIFLAALLTASRLANNTEIVAILAGGISYYRVVYSFAVVAVFLAGADLVLKNYYFPHAAGKVIDFEIKYVQKHYQFDKRNVHRQLDTNTYFYVQWFNVHTNTASQFTLERFEGKDLVYKLRSHEAYYDTVSQQWIALNYVLRQIDGLNETLQKGDSMRLNLPISHEEFGQKVKTLPSTPTPELNRIIATEQERGSEYLQFYLIEKYRRLSMPISNIILVLMAVAIASRKKRGGIGAHILVGILIAFSYEIMMRFSTTFSTNANLDPAIAVTIPNVFYGVLAIVMLKKTPK